MLGLTRSRFALKLMSWRKRKGLKLKHSFEGRHLGIPISQRLAQAVASSVMVAAASSENEVAPGILSR